ncbi:MAG: ATP-binding protein [Candidatus Omnitrophica bacterium]|nr:ATP-binding protein [Candidatus Omnitrophota bacterium]
MSGTVFKKYLERMMRSVRFQIGVLYTSVLGAILLIYSVILYFNLSYILYREMDANLERKSLAIMKTVKVYSRLLEPPPSGEMLGIKRVIHIYDVERKELIQWPVIMKVDRAWKREIDRLGLDRDYIAVISPKGYVLNRSKNMTGQAFKRLRAVFREEPADKIRVVNAISKDLKLRIMAWPVINRNRVKYTIVIATPIEPPLFTLKSKMKDILFTIFIVLVFTSALGSFFVANIFRPIAEITKAARTISYKDMSKRVEKKLADAEIIALVDAFNDMISRLEKSFQYIEEFSSNVSHELKTPIAIIRGESEIALRSPKNEEEYRKAIGIILEESQRMLRTIDDLLLLARLDYRPNVFKFEKTDLVAFIAEIYEQAALVAQSKNISVFIDAAVSPLIINADKLHLRRLFFNLVDNAVKFTPSAGRITFTVKREGAKAVVAVSDTGAGIAEEYLPKIFERFFSVDRTQRATGSGSGLGLSIVKSIANIHQADIRVTSELHKGTTFFITFPLL